MSLTGKIGCALVVAYVALCVFWLATERYRRRAVLHQLSWGGERSALEMVAGSRWLSRGTIHITLAQMEEDGLIGSRVYTSGLRIYSLREDHPCV